MSLMSWLRARFAKPIPSPRLETDNAVRMHIAASDPSFPAKREAAVAAITAAIDTVAAAHGFTTKAQSWAKSGPLGTVTLHLQRSRYGFDCQINLGFQPVCEPETGPWALDDFISPARFLPDTTTGDGTLIYLDVNDDPSKLATAIAALNDNALPWLLAHLTNPDAALIDPMPSAPAAS